MRHRCGLIAPAQAGAADPMGITGMETASNRTGRMPAQTLPTRLSAEDTGIVDSPPPAEAITPMAREELAALERAQLIDVAMVLLEAMPNSCQWSVVSSIRRARRRRPPACRDRLQSP